MMGGPTGRRHRFRNGKTIEERGRLGEGLLPRSPLRSPLLHLHQPCKLIDPGRGETKEDLRWHVVIRELAGHGGRATGRFDVPSCPKTALGEQGNVPFANDRSVWHSPVARISTRTSSGCKGLRKTSLSSNGAPTLGNRSAVVDCDMMHSVRYVYRFLTTLACPSVNPPC